METVFSRIWSSISLNFLDRIEEIQSEMMRRLFARAGDLPCFGVYQ